MFTFVIMEIRDRIKVIIKVNQLTATSFADEIGVQRSSISHILNGRNKPSLDFIQKVLKKFPRVNPLWLITGEENKESVDTRESHVASASTSFSDPKKKPSTIKPRKGKQVDRIVIFYTDRTFEAYEGS